MHTISRRPTTSTSIPIHHHHQKRTLLPQAEVGRPLHRLAGNARSPYQSTPNPIQIAAVARPGERPCSGTQRDDPFSSAPIIFCTNLPSPHSYPPKRQASSHQILFFIISAHTPVAPSPLSFSAIMQKYIPLVAHRPKNVTSSIVRSPEEERRKPGPWKVRGWADP